MTSLASNDGYWSSVGTFEGVEVSWRWRKELKEQYISELRFRNITQQDLDITFQASFVDWTGAEHTEGGQRFRLKAGSQRAGQWSGKFYYPGDTTRPPQRGGIRNMVIKSAR